MRHQPLLQPGPLLPSLRTLEKASLQRLHAQSGAQPGVSHLASYCRRAGGSGGQRLPGHIAQPHEGVFWSPQVVGLPHQAGSCPPGPPAPPPNVQTPPTSASFLDEVCIYLDSRFYE